MMLVCMCYKMLRMGANLGRTAGAGHDFDQNAYRPVTYALRWDAAGALPYHMFPKAERLCSALTDVRALWVEIRHWDER